jgi:thymidylate kinase
MSNAALMIVLEGPECTGKSTQIQLMAEEYSCQVNKRVRTSSRFQMLSTVINDILQQEMRTSGAVSEALVLFDRWQLVSDIVYEKYCYARTSILEPLLDMFSYACDESNVRIIYLSIDEDEMIRRFRLRGDKLRTIEEAIIVRKAYVDFFATCPLPFIEINVTGKTIEEVNKEIILKSGIINIRS